MRTVADTATATASRSSSPLVLRLSGGRLRVRSGLVAVRVSCSGAAPAELLMLARSRRIAHKRFTCRPAARTVRMRLNRPGRRLLAREDRVQARLLLLAGDQTILRRVLLVSSGGG